MDYDLFEMIILQISNEEYCNERTLSLICGDLFGIDVDREELLSDSYVRKNYLLLIKRLKYEFKKYDISVYKLVNENGEYFLSLLPGVYGGNKRLKIYGMLDCPSANRWISKGYYVKDRVFFLDEDSAFGAGYRPCSICMRKKYNEWKSRL